MGLMETENLGFSHEQYQQLYEAMIKRLSELQQPEQRPSVLADLHAKSGNHQTSQVSHKSKSKEETR